MEWTTLNVSSVTNAIRGKTILERRGFTAHVQRAFQAGDNNGCGYRLLVKGDGAKARALLQEAGLRVNRSENGGRG